MKLSRRVAFFAVLCAVFASAAWMLLDLAEPRNNAGRQLTEQNDNREPQPSSPETADPAIEAVATTSREQLGLGALPGGTEDLATQLVDAFKGGEQNTQPTELLIDRLRDQGLPLIDRRKAAWRLAEDGTPDAMAALEAASAEGSPYLRATIAEALGYFQHSQALALLSKLLEDDDPIVARGAVRGVAANGDPAANDFLSAILADDGSPDSVRAEAAVGLAGVADRDSSDVLISAFDEVRSQDGDLWEGVLEGLGSRPFPEVSDFYVDLVDSSDDPEVRTVAIESLSESTGEVAPFLLRVAERDADPEVRAAAAWALGSLDDKTDLGKDLTDLLQNEDDQEVRRNIYGAIGSQANAPFDRVLKNAMDEPDLDVRLQGLGSAARLLSTRSFAPQRRQFDAEIVPDLLDIVLNDGQLHRQINALNALIVADTHGAQTAVRIVADADDPMLSEAARQALGEPRSTAMKEKAQ